MKKIIKNGILITPFREVKNGNIVIQGNKISDVIEGDLKSNLDDVVYIDADNNYVAPGFFDIHVHGGGNGEVMDGKVESIVKMCKVHSQFGTTSIVPTTSSASLDDLYRAIDAVRDAQKENTGANILGIHLEGPYFSPQEMGAQDPKFIHHPDPKEYVKLLDYWEGILIMSAAPELPGGLGLGRELRKRGIIASIGHSAANYSDVIAAVENGYTQITHFYSGCSLVHRVNAYRIAGIVESGYLMDELTVEIIADGKHLPSSLLKLIYKIKGADRIILMTDGTAFSGLKIKEHQVMKMDTREVILEDGVMKLMDRSSFAGSIATTNLLVKNMNKLANVPLKEAVKMATYNPARALKMSDRKGTISIGMDADLVIFNKNLDIMMTIVAGNIVYKQDKVN